MPTLSRDLLRNFGEPFPMPFEFDFPHFPIQFCNRIPSTSRTLMFLSRVACDQESPLRSCGFRTETDRKIGAFLTSRERFLTLRKTRIPGREDHRLSLASLRARSGGQLGGYDGGHHRSRPVSDKTFNLIGPGPEIRNQVAWGMQHQPAVVGMLSYA